MSTAAEQKHDGGFTDTEFGFPTPQSKMSYFLCFHCRMKIMGWTSAELKQPMCPLCNGDLVRVSKEEYLRFKVIHTGCSSSSPDYDYQAPYKEPTVNWSVHDLSLYTVRMTDI